MNEKFERMFQTARTNVEAALKRKDPKVSMWFIDMYLKQKGRSVKIDREMNVSTPEGLRDLSTHALELAKNGTISLDQLKDLQEAIARQMVLIDSSMIKDLRREIDEMALALQTKNASQGHLPAWGRLRLVASKDEVIDEAEEAEDLAASRVSRMMEDD